MKEWDDNFKSLNMKYVLGLESYIKVLSKPLTPTNRSDLVTYVPV
jgi:hypothetical protein